MKEEFTVLHNDNSVFEDHSFLSKDFGSQGYILDLEAANDYLYVGHYKPFNFFYVELEVKNTVVNSFTAEYYDEVNTAWTALTIVDETEGLTKSGFIRFEKPENWKNTTINSLAKYFIRLQPSASHDITTKVKGLALVFSDDNDLIEERSTIVSKHAPASGSWIMKHQAAKKDIIQKIRNDGNFKYNDTVKNKIRDVGSISSITEFDILEYDQIRQASKYLVLSKIFLYELSDDPEDKWFVLGREFEEKYTQAMSLYILNLDIDDDGSNDDEQATSIGNVNVVRR